MVRRSLAGIGVVVAVVVLAFSGGLLRLMVEWVLFGYLCWRAAPGVWRDVSRVRVPGVRSLRRRRGEVL